jgi:hypothetical protein
MILRNLFFGFIAAYLLISCEPSQAGSPDTERFYSNGGVWQAKVHRSHNAIGSTPQADENYETEITISKGGDFFINETALGYHMYQYWAYSWSTDAFYMNWDPCLHWYINETSDSMYMDYHFNDYDPNTGNSFYWLYEIEMTR